MKTINSHHISFCHFHDFISGFNLGNDTLAEEIEEDIPETPKMKEYELIDPFSGEKLQARKKVLCRLDVSSDS
jgi:hypothetical protein